MATILQQSRHTQDQTNQYHSGEMITLVLGFMLMIMAFGSIFDENFLGLSLTPMHAMVLAGSGAMAVWSALFRDEDEKRAYLINLVLGLFFLANAIAGLLLDGATKTRTLINESTMNSIAPGFLQLNTIDHVMHGLLAVWFLVDSFIWKRRHHF